MKAKLLLLPILFCIATIHTAQEVAPNKQGPDNSAQATKPKSRNKRSQPKRAFTQNEIGPVPRYDHEGTYLYSVAYTCEVLDGKKYLKPSISF